MLTDPQRGRIGRAFMAIFCSVALILAFVPCGVAEAANAAGTSDSSSETKNNTDAYKPGELIVEYTDNTDIEKVVEDSDVDATVSKQVEMKAENNDLALVELDKSENIDAAKAELKADPNITNVYYNLTVQASATSSVPNDPYYRSGSYQWGLKSGNGINASSMWNSGTRGTDKVVAIIDSGVDLDHPDLANNLWTNPYRDLRVNGTTGAGTHGYDYVGKDWNPNDEYGHGTHAAGIIGAQGNNSRGVTGVCQEVKILPLRVLDSSGRGNLFDVIEAYRFIEQIQERGTDVVAINCSFGQLLTSSEISKYSEVISLMNTAIEEVGKAGALTFTAAGNNSVNLNGSSKAYPAACSSSYNVCVAATTNTGARASFSNYGTSYVDIAAPGSSIYSTAMGGGYCYKNGTSMATPMVAGSAALIAARIAKTGATPTASKVKSTLLGSTHFSSALTGKVASSRQLDLSKYSAGLSFGAYSTSFAVSGSNYSVNSSSAVTLTKFKSSAKTVNIPSTVSYQGRSYRVTVIGSNAVASAATKVSGARNITTINSNAFAKATHVTKFEILSSGLTKINSNAFIGLKKASTIKFTSTKIKTVGTNAFKNVPSRAKIYVKSSKKSSYKKLFNKKGLKKACKFYNA